MKEIVKNNVMREYFIKKALLYDDFLAFRRNFSYQYGTLIALHYVLSISTNLQNFNIHLQTGNLIVY